MTGRHRAPEPRRPRERACVCWACIPRLVETWDVSGLCPTHRHLAETETALREQGYSLNQARSITGRLA